MTTSNQPDKVDVGTLWEIKTKADKVEVVRPDGSTVHVAAFDGVAGIVLNVAGDYSADVDGTAHAIKAG